ncbi:MAG: sensor domain-containing diguanylate cyclase [Propionivibrio sp.]
MKCGIFSITRSASCGRSDRRRPSTRVPTTLRHGRPSCRIRSTPAASAKATPAWIPRSTALDQPGSADRETLRLGIGLALLIATVALGVIAFGDVQLTPYPQFATFYATFVFLLDAITGVVLLGHFRYRRRLAYAVLAAAYLFKALTMVPFLLTFPGGLLERAQVMGGPQSSVWVWTCWHIVFPLFVAVAAAIDRRAGDAAFPAQRLRAAGATAAAVAGALAVAIQIAVTRFHDRLPALIDLALNSVTPAFYAMSVLAALATLIPALHCWREGRRRRTILHLWLALTLSASLADVLVSMGTTTRYSVGWYFGRVESMIAASVLLILFLNETNRLHGRLAIALDGLLARNRQLAALLHEKEELVAGLRDSEEQVRQLAYYDPLTELPNRRLLLDRLQQALNHARRKRCSLAVMFTDLDRFKEINDTLGHDAGDKLLIQVAGRLTGCLRKGDTASRSGGDEFIVVLPEIGHPEDAALVAAKIVDALAEPVTLGGAGEQRVKVSISIGIAIYPIDGADDLRDLLQKADQAMYAAKAEGRNQFRFYASGMAVKKPDPADL